MLPTALWSLVLKMAPTPAEWAGLAGTQMRLARLVREHGTVRNSLARMLSRRLSLLTDAIDIEQLSQSTLAHMSVDHLKQLLMLVNVTTQSLRYDSTITLLKALGEGTLVEEYDDLRYLLQLIRAKLFVDPQLPYHLDGDLFDQGFDSHKACISAFPDSADHRFVAAAYWHQLYYRFCHELTTLQQDNTPKIAMCGLRFNQWSDYLEELSEQMKLCRRAILNCTDEVEQAVALVDQGLSDDLIQQDDQDLMAAFAHPSARGFVVKMAALIDGKKIALQDILQLSSPCLYRLCWPRYRWLLNPDKYPLSSIKQLDGRRFKSLKSPLLRRRLATGVLNLTDYQDLTLEEISAMAAEEELPAKAGGSIEQHSDVSVNPANVKGSFFAASSASPHKRCKIQSDKPFSASTPR